MGRKWFVVLTVVFVVFVVMVIVFFSLRSQRKEQVSGLDSAPVVSSTAGVLAQPTATPVLVPIGTALALPTETPAFPTPTPAPTATPTVSAVSTATAIATPSSTSVPTETPEPIATGTPTPISTPTPIIRGYLFPLFFLQEGESKTLTIPLEPAGVAVFEFETNGPSVELQVFYQGELGFSQRCKDFRDPTKPFNSHVFLPVEVSHENPSPEFTFTNSCGVPSVQVSAGYTIILQP